MVSGLDSLSMEPAMKCAALVLAVISLLGVFALADEGHHHEDLTPEQLGTVHFPVSCAPPAEVVCPRRRAAAFVLVRGSRKGIRADREG